MTRLLEALQAQESMRTSTPASIVRKGSGLLQSPDIKVRDPQRSEVACFKGFIWKRERIKGLLHWLRSLHLQEIHCEAEAWCEKVGARCVEDLVDHLDEFSMAFDLKPYDRDRIR